MRAALLLMLLNATGAEEAFGVWKLNSARSTLVGNQRSVTLRIELRRQSSGFPQLHLFGIAMSRRVDGSTVDILRQCADGNYRQSIRRSAAQPGVLILELTEQHKDGRRSQRRFVLEKR